MSNSSKEEILGQITTALVDLFELDPAIVTEDAKLADDLELDSIDLFDLLIRLEETSGRKVASKNSAVSSAWLAM